MLDFGLVAEALQERGLLHQTRSPRTWSGRCRSSTRCKHRGWERLYAGAGVALYDTLGAAVRAVARRARTTGTSPAAAPAGDAVAAQGRAGRRAAVLRRARSTTRGTRCSSPAPRRRTARTSPTGPGSSSCCARASGWSARWCTTWSRARPSASGPGRSSTPPGSGPTTRSRSPASAASSTSARARASTSWCRATGSARDSGLILRTEKSVLFVIPWGRHWIIGTTDTDWSLDKAHPAASPQRTSTTCSSTSTACCGTPLTHEDVEGVYAGLRPLLSGESESTSKLSREHAVAHTVPGLVVVAGGKYTTYRVMAKDAVDEAVVRATRRARCPPSVTERRPAARRRGLSRRCGTPRHLLAQRYGLHVARIEHLLGRYGSLATEVLDLVAADPTLGEPLAGRAGLPAGRDRLRGLARGRAAPRRRCWPAVPASRSRRSTAASASMRGGRPAGGAGAGLERGAGRRGRSSTTASGSRPSGRARPCPTTRPPTPPAWARPRSCRCAEAPPATSHPLTSLRTPSTGCEVAQGVRSGAGLRSTPWGI